MVLAFVLLRLAAGRALEIYVLRPRLTELSCHLQSDITYREASFSFLGPSVTFKDLKVPHPRNFGSGPLLEAGQATISLSWFSLPDQRTVKIHGITLEGALLQGRLDSSRSLIPVLCLPALLLGGAYDQEGHYVPRYRYAIDKLDIEGRLRLSPEVGQPDGDFTLENLHIEGEDLHNLPDGPEGSFEIAGRLGTSELRINLENWLGFDDYLRAATGKIRIEIPSLALPLLNPLLRHSRAQAEFQQGTATLQWHLDLEHGSIAKAESPVVLQSLLLRIEDPGSPLAPIEPWLKMTGGSFSAPVPISGTLEKPRIGFTTFDMKRLLRN
ncbi:MAG: hypothetical protein AB7F75_07205 [Planctomycetota bacterium]